MGRNQKPETPIASFRAEQQQSEKSVLYMKKENRNSELFEDEINLTMWSVSRTMSVRVTQRSGLYREQLWKYLSQLL